MAGTARPPLRPAGGRLGPVPPRDADLRVRTVHGYRRAFRVAGSGPAVVLIHGIGDSSATWESVIPALARHHLVIAPDLLGHGRSDKPRADYSVAAYANGVRDLLGVLGIRRATLVGHSLGGGVAMQFAYQFPDRTERLVLVGSGGAGPEVNPVLRAMTLPGATAALHALRLPTVRWQVGAASRPCGCSAQGSAATHPTCSGWSTPCPTRPPARPSSAPCVRSSTGAARS
jgi:pimeloyl-ACP methyl ester carboxylesterase